VSRALSRLAESEPTYLCSACVHFAAAFAPGPGGRVEASCPRCGSLERHRFLALLLEGLAPAVSSARLVLDVAPTAITTRLLRRLAPARYVRIDFDPAADRRAVDVRASLTGLPLREGSADLIVCFHVLEHIPDDASALAELRRALSWGGIALVQVPWRARQLTEEDPDAPPQERARRFGQADHVRWYGSDFDTRIERAGLRALRVAPRDVLGERAAGLFRLLPDEAVWIVRREDGSARSGFDPAALRSSVLVRLVEALDEARRGGFANRRWRALLGAIPGRPSSR
jgi:SAM-dependent methyltransferase